MKTCFEMEYLAMDKTKLDKPYNWLNFFIVIIFSLFGFLIGACMGLYILITYLR